MSKKQPPPKRGIVRGASRLAHRARERKDLRKTQDIGDQQHQEYEDGEEQDAADAVAAGGQGIELRGKLRRLIVGKRGDARLELRRIDTVRLELSAHLRPIQEAGHPAAITGG